MPEWWNRQTRGIQNPVPVMGVWVQVPPPVLTVKGLTSNRRESFFAFLEPRLPSMREIQSELLWTGNARDARDARGLIDGGISAIVDLAYEELPAQLPRQLVYCRFPIVDGAGNDPLLLRLALLTTVELLRSGTPAIVACSAGMSRSPMIAICALAVHVDQSPESVLAVVNEKSSFELHGDLWTDVCEIAAELRADAIGDQRASYE